MFLPPTTYEHIYFFEYPANFEIEKCCNWVYQSMMWPRKYAEWIQCIDGLRKPIFTGPQLCLLDKIFNISMDPNPWQRCIAADQLEACFRRNQWIRWQMRRVLMRLRQRIMDRRVIGETDVGTLEPIPKRLCVSVYDWRTRSRYQFHANTMHRQIAETLRYQTMAMSMPRYPQNPYTNLPWSMGQLLVLYDQMQTCMWNAYRKFLDPATQAFYISNLCLKTFQGFYGSVLDVECARRFFRDATSDYWELLYSDTLDDIFLFLQPQNKFKLKFLLIHRNFSKHLLREWDDMVLGFWCYENLNRVIHSNMSSIHDMVDAARNLLERTNEVLAKRKALKNLALLQRNGQ